MDNEVSLDFARTKRTGLSEAIFCSGKSIGQLDVVLKQAAERSEPMLFTRLDEEMHAAVEALHPGSLDYDPVSRTAIFASDKLVGKERARPAFAVITAGSSDVPVAREARRTLEFQGETVTEINDIGVAGLWRLSSRLPEIVEIPVIIVAAGMDGALPTVIAGLVPGSVIALPTSVGYGTARGGETALSAQLCSCAPGLVVVNIDNGYGAACAAVRILRSLEIMSSHGGR